MIPYTYVQKQGKQISEVEEGADSNREGVRGASWGVVPPWGLMRSLCGHGSSPTCVLCAL